MLRSGRLQAFPLPMKFVAPPPTPTQEVEQPAFGENGITWEMNSPWQIGMETFQTQTTQGAYQIQSSTHLNPASDLPPSAPAAPGHKSVDTKALGDEAARHYRAQEMILEKLEQKKKGWSPWITPIGHPRQVKEIEMKQKRIRADQDRLRKQMADVGRSSY